MQKYFYTLFLSLFFIACKNDKKKDEISQLVSEEHNYIESNSIKYYTQDELISILSSDKLDNDLEISKYLDIADTVKIKNIKTGCVNSYNLFLKEPQYCFLKDHDLYLILNNCFHTYNSDNYYIKINSKSIGLKMDSLDMHHSCFEIGYAANIKKYKLCFNKEKYDVGDTLKCRAIFLNYGKFNDCTKDFYKYFLDSMDVKYIVHPFDSKIHQELLSKFPK